jgi:GGDEF domain-containing protein
MDPVQISKLIGPIKVNNGIIVEVGPVDYVKNIIQRREGFGPGVSAGQFGSAGGEIEAKGLPFVDFERAWSEAEELEKIGRESEDIESVLKALVIYKKLADIHPVSGLKSKSYFKRHRVGEKLFVVIDLDNLKYLNTKLGHAGADSILRAFGDALDANFGSLRLAKTFHKSGDEFYILIDRKDISDDELGTLVRDVQSRCNGTLKSFANNVFVGEGGDKARATATFGIGLDEISTDKLVERMKNKRKGI